jgi:hypothetical protein
MLREALGLLGADARLGIWTGTGARLGLAHGRRLKVEAREARHTERQAKKKLLAGRAAVRGVGRQSGRQAERRAERQRGRQSRQSGTSLCI